MSKSIETENNNNKNLNSLTTSDDDNFDLLNEQIDKNFFSIFDEINKKNNSNSNYTSNFKTNEKTPIQQYRLDFVKFKLNSIMTTTQKSSIIKPITNNEINNQQFEQNINKNNFISK